MGAYFNLCRTDLRLLLLLFIACSNFGILLRLFEEHRHFFEEYGHCFENVVLKLGDRLHIVLHLLNAVIQCLLSYNVSI